MVSKVFTSLLLLFLGLAPLWSINKINHTTHNPLAKDYVVAQKLDDLKNLNIFTDSIKPDGSKTSSYPSFPDLVYEIKIASIDRLSPISFDYNDYVRRYIDIYTQERRDQVSQMLALSELYFPLFDEILDKHFIPLEFKYLAVVESALNPLAVSPSGAVGLWQFKINTGKMFDLEVNSYIDERRDPVKSTEAACQYLNYLYRIFNDWHLVMAAYNAGPGVVRNAIFRSGGETNFWKIYSYLPEAAQNYVPAFIAAAYVMQNSDAHDINKISPIMVYSQTDTVHVSKPVSFTALAAETNIPIDILRFLNPIYRRDFIPELDSPAAIRIPESKIKNFLVNEQVIYEKSQVKPDFHEALANAGSTEEKHEITYKVQTGDYLHKIAINYGCTIDDISIWNPNLQDELNVGQTITLWVDYATYQIFLNRSNLKAD